MEEFHPAGQAPYPAQYMDNNQIKAIFSRIGVGFALLMLIPKIVGGTISGVLAAVNPALATQGWFLWAVSYVPLYGIGFPIFLKTVRSIPNGTGGPAQPLKVGGGAMVQLIFICIGIVYPLNYLVILLSSLMEHLLGTGIVNPLEAMVSGSDPWMNLIVVGFIAPVMEEIIFRRILRDKLIVFGGKVYIFFSAFLFAMFHGNLYQIPYAFVLGALFAGITYYTGTIKYSIILHIIINLIGGSLFPLVASYLPASMHETATFVYSAIVYGMMAVGIVLLVYWIVKYRKQIHFEPGAVTIPKKSLMFANGGVMFFIILMLIIMLTTILTPFLLEAMQRAMAAV